MDRNGIEFIASHYGIDVELNQLQEECGELIQAVNKRRRTGSNAFLIEEIADVQMVIYEIEHLLGCKSQVERIIDLKTDRQIDRIEEDEF